MKTFLHIMSVAFLCCATLFLGATSAVAADIPKYTVIQTLGDNIELRDYPPSLIAQVRVSGDRDDAASKAFSVLAGFIFSGNDRDEKISMTAPVTQIPEAFTTEGDAQNWTVDFRMPEKYSAQTLPVPNNDAITIIEVPSQQFVAIQFSGRGTVKNLTKHREELTKILEKNNDISVGPTPIYAFYDAPFVPGFMRRNEVMYRVLP